MPPRRSRPRTTLAALLLSATPAFPDTLDWLPTAPTPALFSDPANWSTNTAPSPADTARFNTNTTHTVTLTSDATTDTLAIVNDSLTLDLTGRTYTLGSATDSVASGTLTVGAPTTSSLALVSTAPATLAAETFLLAPAAGDTASVSITGPVTLLGFRNPNVTLSTFTFAQSGSASLTLADGAAIDALSANAATTLATNAGSSAMVTLAGPGTRWTLGGATFGLRGNADVRVTSGATLTPTLLYLGNDSTAKTASGSLTVDGPGSSVQGQSEIHVGYRSHGSLAIRNGGSASLLNLYVATNSGSSGAVTLEDPGSSLTITASTYLGGSNSAAGGAGTLTIAGGTASLGNVKIWNKPGTSLNLSGGSLTARSIDLANTAQFHWTGGTLELTNSAVQVSNPTTVTPASNNKLNVGPTLNLTTGMSLKISSQPNTLHYLVVDNGGSLSATGASISVGDTAFVGYASTGTLSLADHASLSTKSGILGLYANQNGNLQHGTGTATLDSYSTWSLAGSLTIGGDGPGSLTIRGGSAVTVSADAVVGNGSLPVESTLSIDGPGSSLAVAGTLTLSKNTRAVFTVSNGASVTTSSAIVSTSAPQLPSLFTLQGANTRWSNSGTFYVARSNTNALSNGSLTLSDSASLTTSSFVLASGSQYAQGALLLISGATLNVSNSAYLGGFASPQAASASLSLTDSSATIGSLLKIWNTPNTATTLIRSTLTLGTPSSPATLDNSATISLSDHSTLTNPGTLSLDPTSQFLWTPAPTDPDPLSTLRTELSTHHLTSSDPTLTLAYTPVNAGPQLRIFPTIPGDANLDGLLNADDYTLLDRSFSRNQPTALWTDGDFNYDGQITPADYLLLDTAYYQSHPASPALLAQRTSQFGPTYVSQLLTTIPEPSALFSILYPLSSLLLPRPRRRYTIATR